MGTRKDEYELCEVVQRRLFRCHDLAMTRRPILVNPGSTTTTTTTGKLREIVERRFLLGNIAWMLHPILVFRVARPCSATPLLEIWSGASFPKVIREACKTPIRSTIGAAIGAAYWCFPAKVVAKVVAKDVA